MIPADRPEAAPLLPLDRRSLLKGGLLGAGLLGAPLAAQVGTGGFTHGVASGEPGPNGVLLWTRYLANGETGLTWQVMEADANRKVVAEGTVTASPANDGCAKAIVTGLDPDRWYYYRFTAPDGSQSDEGRTRTLPEGPTARFRMAVFSCSNIGFGWFNAYAHAAEADEFDLVLHLGDYIYEHALGSYPGPKERVAGRDILPLTEIVALSDYRQRYASYRADRDLQRLHQLFPFVTTWDDHETANDAWKNGAENHQSDTEGDYQIRKAAARKAYREWLPVSDQDWASYEIGDLATLFRLESRLGARSVPLDLAPIFDANADAASARGALAAFRDGAWQDPSREMLGGAQQAWLGEGFARSRRAGKVWQVLANQTIMGRLDMPASAAEGIPEAAGGWMADYLTHGAIAASVGLPSNLDAWDGFPAARSRLLASAQAADANLVVLTGDSHNAWAFDLPHDRQPAGVEFAGTSVSSPGAEHYVRWRSPEWLARETIAANPQLKWTDQSHRGYMAVELTPGSATCEHRFLTSVTERGAKLAGTARQTCLAGKRTLDIG